MKEWVYVSLPEKHARKLFGRSEGKKDTFVDNRIVEFPKSDPRFEELGRLQYKYNRWGQIFAHIAILRSYSKRELESAELLRVTFGGLAEPVGELVGTQYDESPACKHCGAGGRIVGALRLKSSALPKKRDFGDNYAGEAVISANARAVFEAEKISGLTYGVIFGSGNSQRQLENWFQLNVDVADAEIVSPTLIGEQPYAWYPNEYKCPMGDNLGPGWHSELWVRRAQSALPDILQTRQYYGVRSGLCRPERFYLVSQRFREVVLKHKLKGCTFEVAHLNERAG
jgi:hypothetical protein